MRLSHIAATLAFTASSFVSAAPVINAILQQQVPACQACHLSSSPQSSAPHIAGQRQGYLAKQLTAFKVGARKDAVMNAIAAQLSDTDIAALTEYWSNQPASSDALVPPEIAAIKKSRMSFPADFPKGFVIYRTQNDSDSNSVSKSYVNSSALQAAKARLPLPGGSIVIVASYPVKLAANGKPLVGPDGQWIAEAASSYSGMEARSAWGEGVPPLLRNGNWHYNIFAADRTPNETLNQAVCLACHKPIAKQSFVFTLNEIERAANAAR